MRARKSIRLLMLLCAMAILFAVPAHAVSTSGTVGNGFTWTMRDNVTMVISGTGALPDGDRHLVLDWYKQGTKVEHLVFEEGITYIGDYNFYRYNSPTYKKIQSVTIPTSVTQIGKYAFCNLSNLDSVYISDLAIWCTMLHESSSNPLDNKADLYLNGELVDNLVIPSSVDHIGAYAFKGCTSLTSVEVHANIKSVGAFAFNTCSNLKEIRFLGDAPEFGDYVFTLTELTAYYPAANPTWTADKLQDYGGKVVWVPIQCEGDHNEVVDTGEAPSCTQSGLTDGTHCSLCGEIIKEQTKIPATGHSYGAWKIVTAATVEAEGLEKRTCGDCGKKEEWTIAKLEPEVTEPPVTEPETTEPEISEPEATEPEFTEPEVTKPLETEPENTQSGNTEPQSTEQKHNVQKKVADTTTVFIVVGLILLLVGAATVVVLRKKKHS